MNTRAKLAVVFGALIVVLALAGQSRASIETTISGWNGNPQTDQDKVYTLVAGTTLPSNTEIKFDTLVIPGLDIHYVDSSGLRAGIWQLNYTIQIVGAPLHFVDVSLDSDVPSQTPDVKVIKNVFTSDGSLLLVSLVSLSGNPDGPKTIPGNRTMILVEETFRVDQGDAPGAGSLRQASNTYTETVIPEPATVIIWSLLGLGWVGGMQVMRRRRSSVLLDGGPNGRAVWTEENRVAIRNIIDRSRSQS